MNELESITDEAVQTVVTLSQRDPAAVIMNMGLALTLAMDYIEEFGADGYDVTKKMEAIRRVACGGEP